MSTLEHVFDSWEEMEESGALDRRLDALQLTNADTIEDQEITRLTSMEGTTRMIILGEDAVRSQYVPPKPTVKILKRPSRDSQGSGDGPFMNGEKPKQPIKSLKQREQEYAEARKRILGEERSPDEKLVQEISRIQLKPIVLNTAVAATTTTTTTSTSTTNVPSNVVRMPIGPDGTRGFNVRR